MTGDAVGGESPAQRIGRAIHHVCREAGMRQEDAAAAVGVTQSTISDWINGRSEPSASRLVLIDRACGQPPGHIMTLAGLLDDTNHATRKPGNTMEERAFQDCALWRHALTARQGRDPQRPDRARLRNSYLELRSTITPLWAELSEGAPGWLQRDISHTDAMWETASVLCGEAVDPNPAEAYVLGCAFVVHNAAMCLGGYPDGLAAALGARWRDLLADRLVHSTGRWPNPDEIDTAPDEIRHQCVIEALRRLPAKQAYGLVEQRWRRRPGTDGPLIADTQLADTYGDLIAQLAWSHWQDTDSLLTELGRTHSAPHWLPADWSVDPVTLACILRVVDAATLDTGRTPSFGHKHHVPSQSWGHWPKHLARPYLQSNKLAFTSPQSFGATDAAAWWHALDYLQALDRELKDVDELLDDLGKPRLAARGVAGVRTPEAFAQEFEVNGWCPVDADIQIADIRQHITTLMGHITPEAACTALIENAHDAILARQALDPAFADGEILVSVEQRSDGWYLIVRDNGIGMDQHIITHGLLTFGRSGWRTETIRSSFVGLTSNGFQPAGRRGIGFYTAFTLGDQITVTTRRYDHGHADTRQLHLNGLHRPLLTPAPADLHTSPGTTVEVKLKPDPGGPLTTHNITDVVQHLNTQVPVTVTDHPTQSPPPALPSPGRNSGD